MPGFEILVVGATVLVAAIWAVRAIWRSMRSGTTCSDCSQSGSCPLVENPKLLEEIMHEGKLGLLDHCGPGSHEDLPCLTPADASKNVEDRPEEKAKE